MTPIASTTIRQDIQQLRGVAVLAVIVNHLGIDLLPGGYLGVDMFFVVSGFVITLSMLSGHATSTSRLRFLAQFWIRRTFRLWPMLFATVIAATAVLLVTGLANPDVLLTGAASVLALSNIRLLLGRLEYFALETGTDWFMHTWSLATEEQIYVVLSVVFSVVGIRTPIDNPARRVRTLVAAVGTLAIVSLIFAMLPSTSEVVRFYSPHTRFYQVAVGALIALWFAGRGNRIVEMASRIRTVVLVSSAGGLAALFLTNPWSGRTASLATTVLTMIVIGAAHHRHHVSGFVPGGWLGRVGDRSYSLYLVHWPVQLLAATLIEASYPRYAVSLAATFAIAYLAYREIDDRTRHHWKALRIRRSVALASAALLGTLGVTVLGYLRADQIARGSAVEYPSRRCTNESGSVWVVGDSHLTHAPVEPVLARALDGDCLNVGGYGVVMEVVWLDRESAGRREVRMRLSPTAWLIEQIRSGTPPPRALVVVHFLSAFMSDPSTAPGSANFAVTEWESPTGETVTRAEFTALFAENLRQISAAMADVGGELVVTSPPPDFDWLSVDIDVSLCSNRIVVSRECAEYRREARLSLEAHEARGGEVRRLLDGLQRNLPNFTHIRLDTPFCGPEYCSNFHDGEPAYQDDDHLNVVGARLVEPILQDELTRIVGSPPT